MNKTAAELYAADCKMSHGDGNYDYWPLQMFRSHFSKLCRSGFFTSAVKEKNAWTVDEGEYFEKASELRAYIELANVNHPRRAHISLKADGYKAAVDGANRDVSIFLWAVGVVVGLGLGLMVIVNVLTSPSNYSPSPSVGTRERLEDRIRREAERLYDNCQRYGKSFDPRC